MLPLNPSGFLLAGTKVYTNDDVVQIRPTTRKGDVWSNYDLCVMIDGVEKARCKKCSKFYNPTSNTTLRTHKSGCSAVSQNDTSQGTIGADGQVFIFDNDAVRLDFTKFVIQQALPFNHFDNVKLTEARRVYNFEHFGMVGKKGNHISILSAMARDLLTVQASTVAFESAFSISGRIISERRSRLTPESVEVCVCLKDYLDGVDRVQHETSLEGPILEDVEETIAREEVDLGISPPNTELDEGEFEDLDIEHVDVEDFLEDLMD
ncbi:zinc finger BED domain-containing protein RICESLEEPER 2 [Tanacetum coccineum]